MEQPQDPQENNPPFMQFLPVPVMAQRKFAELAGVPFGVLEGWVNRGYVPTIKIGKHTLINLVGLTQECLGRLQIEQSQ